MILAYLSLSSSSRVALAVGSDVSLAACNLEDPSAQDTIVGTGLNRGRATS